MGGTLGLESKILIFQGLARLRWPLRMLTINSLSKRKLVSCKLRSFEIIAARERAAASAMRTE
jgi:hypothetical protein